MPIISMTINVIYDGDLRTLSTHNVSCVPRIGEFIDTEHGVLEVLKVTYDYDDAALTLVTVLLNAD